MSSAGGIGAGSGKRFACGSAGTLHAAGACEKQQVALVRRVVEEVQRGLAVEFRPPLLKPSEDAVISPCVTQDRHEAADQLQTRRAHAAAVASATLKLSDRYVGQFRELTDRQARQPFLEHADR